MQISGFAAHQPKSTLKAFSYSSDTLAPHDVLIKITHCGICHSDVHLIDNDWQISQYPFIPGHEIIGTVHGLGPQVNHLKKGQRVGVGWQAGACLNCEFCLSGDENCCAQSKSTTGRRHGGFAKYVVVDSRFAFPIPEKLDSENAAPLLCAGITVYAPLSKFVRPKQKVGVIGIGGLGHLALQFARAYGCEVTAFSNSPDKKAEALKFGAHHFVVSSKKEEMRKAVSSMDVLLSVVSADLNWPQWFDVLRPNGKLVILGASPSDICVSPGMLIGAQKSIIGNNTGGRAMMGEMLEFAARHNIKAQIELMPLAKVNTALDKVRRNQARYRIVLKCL